MKELKKENLRDHMTNLELVLNMLAEATTTEISKEKNPKTFEDSNRIARQGGTIAGYTVPNVVTDSLNYFYITSSNSVYIIGNDSWWPGVKSLYLFMKLDSSCRPVLAKSAYSPYKFSPFSISLAKNRLGVTGVYRGKLIFENDSLVSRTNIRNNPFIAVYDLEGNLIFLKKIDAAGYCSSNLISLSQSVYVSGILSDTTYFDEQMLIARQDNGGFFLAKLKDAETPPETEAEFPEFYPNPLRGMLTVKISRLYLNSGLEIYDLAGKRVAADVLDAISKTMDLSFLSHGFYIVKIMAADRTFIHKIVKI